MRVLERRCSDTDKHSHRAVIGKGDLGESRASEAAAYPKQLASAYASAARSVAERDLTYPLGLVAYVSPLRILEPIVPWSLPNGRESIMLQPPGRPCGLLRTEVVLLRRELLRA